MRIFNNKILVILILIGSLIRLIWLSGIPSGFFRDEAAIGFNAYSIWHTGKDEFGVRFPLFFRSFEVFFLPLYIYLEAPIVGVFGLSEFTTRILSAVSGIIALAVIYLITKKLKNKTAALFSVLLLAISPWHILYSRGSFEGNLALTLFSTGFLLYLLFISNKKILYFFASLLSFVASIYSYQAERIVVPVFAILTMYLTRNFLWKTRKKLVLPSLFALLLLLPIISYTFKEASLHRASGVSVFTKPPQGLVFEKGDNFIINNRLYLRSKQITALYLSYYSPRNLFFEGDYDKQRSTENFSVFYAWTFPLLVVGIFNVLKRKKVYDKLLLSWILITPIPAALTGDPFHTYRSLLLYFPLTILMAVGAGELLNFAKNKNIYLITFGILSFGSLAFFGYDYAIISQGTRARNWDFGYKQIFDYLDTQNFKKVIIDDPWTEPYIFTLFYEKKNPEIYQREVSRLEKDGDYYYNNSDEIRPVKYENYEFRKVDWIKERGNEGTVFVFWAENLPENRFVGDPKVELLKTINYPNGEVAYRIVRIN